MSSRRYGQYCAVARTLDVVGERWTLLIVRELLDGPSRYVDLLEGVGAIATDILAVRLRHLEESGLVRRSTLPPNGSVRVYELTEEGRSLEPVVDAMARWGMHRLDDGQMGDVIRPSWILRALRAALRPDRGEVDLAVAFVLPEGRVAVRVTATDIVTLDSDDGIDVVVSGTASALVAALDADRVGDLLATGALTVEGAKSAVEAFSGLLR